MAAMAAPEQAMSAAVVGVRGPDRRLAWALWIIVSTLGAGLGAIPAWEIRSLVLGGPVSVQQLVVYAATVLSALILAGAQWLVLRRYRLDVLWWVPATVGANLLAVTIVVPAVVGLGLRGRVSTLNSDTPVIFGAVTLATWGLVIGTAQALVFRKTIGDVAWLWLPATLLAYALAGGVTSALSPTLFGAVIRYRLPVFMVVSLADAVGALLTSICQAPLLARLIRST